MFFLHRTSSRFLSSLFILMCLGLATGDLAAQDSAADAEAAAVLGHASYIRKECAKALVEFEKALAGGIRNGRLLYEAGFCQKATGKSIDVIRRTMAEAVAELDGVVFRDQGQAELIDYDYMARAYAAIGDRNTAAKVGNGALEAYRSGKLGKVNNMSGEEAFRLGHLAATAGDDGLRLLAFARAGEQLMVAQSQDDESVARSFSEVGLVHLTEERYSQARAALEKVQELFPSYPAGRLTYARLLFRLEEYEASRVQWEKLRHEDRRWADQAAYAMMLMRTLDQKDLLLDESQPLDDLRTTSPDDLETMMITLATEMAQLGSEMPTDVAKRGYVHKGTNDSELQAQVKKLRDLKCRLAWVAAEYTDRGFAIREFAFARGMQGLFRSWSLPKSQIVTSEGQPAPLPEHMLTPEQVEFYKEKAAKQQRRRDRKARQAAKEQAAKEDGNP